MNAYRAAALVVVICLYAALAGPIHSQVPSTIGYQGLLTDGSGVVVSDGTYSLTFKLYSVSTGGSALWTETQASVSTTNGVFSVILGSVTPINIAFDKQLYLGITVGGGSELSPRVTLTPSPYSLNSSGVLTSTSGNVGIGTTTPGSHLEVKGTGNTSGTSSFTVRNSDGSPFIHVRDDGAVGIGTTAPAAGQRLTLKASADNTKDFILQKHDNTKQIVAIGESNGSGTVTIKDHTSNTYNHYLDGGAGTNSILAFLTNSKVGIGLNTPTEKLHVQLSAGSTSIAVGEFEAAIGSYTGTSLIASNTLSPASTYNLFAAITDSDGDASGPFYEFVVKGDGKVGIGTSTPGGNLDSGISNTNTSFAGAEGQYALRLLNTDATNNNYVLMTFDDTSPTNIPVAAIGAQITDHTNNYGELAFGTRSGGGFSEKMRIAAGGKVGIGSASPTELVTLGTGNILMTRPGGIQWSGSNEKIYVDDGGLAQAGTIHLKAGGSERLSVNPTSGNVGIGTASPAALLTLNQSLGTDVGGFRLVDGAVTWSMYGDAAGDFHLKGGGSASGELVIDSGTGNVGIGTVSPNTLLDLNRASASQAATHFTNSTSGTTASDGFIVGIDASADALVQNLEATNLLFYTANVQRLVIDAAGNTKPATDNTFTCGTSGQKWSAVWATNGTIQTSDRRLKTDIKDLHPGLRELQKLRPVEFRWKANPGAGVKMGLVAQEVREIIPEAVTEGDDEDKTLGLNYADLVPVLIKGVQEQQTLIDRQGRRIAQLESTVSKLAALVEKQALVAAASAAQGAIK